MNFYITDAETTGLLGSSGSEIIEMHWLYCDKNLNILDEYEFKSRPLKWEEEAELIHKISHNQSLTYPDKHTALSNLCRWLQPGLPVYMYVNQNTELGRVYFDMAALRLHFLDCNRYFDFYDLFDHEMFVSVRDRVIEMDKSGLINITRNAHTGRKSYTQENVYRCLFNKDYNAHNAKDDCYALRQIMVELLALSNAGNFENNYQRHQAHVSQQRFC